MDCTTAALCSTTPKLTKPISRPVFRLVEGLCLRGLRDEQGQNRCGPRTMEERGPQKWLLEKS